MIKKISVLLILFLSSALFGANQIAKDTVVVVGGLGTQADKAALNGGGATKTAWDAGAPTDFIAANGGPISADTGITYDHTGGAVERMFSKAGIGTGVTVGTLAYVSGTNITTGIYEITTVAGDDSYVACADIVATDDNADSVLNIGGAIDILQNALDGQDAASYNRFIYDNISEEETAVTIDLNTYGGSATTKVYIIGYNATLTAEASITITCTGDIDNLFEILVPDYQEFRNINFNAGGKDASKAQYALYAAGTGDGAYNTFYNCNFYGAENDGVLARSQYCSWVNCTFHHNGRYGFNSNGSSGYNRMVTCSVHHNDSHGFYHRWLVGTVSGSIIYTNGVDEVSGSGIYETDSAATVSYRGNTIYNNLDDGMTLNGSSYNSNFINNASVGNGAYNYNFSTMGIGQVGFFAYNLSAAAGTSDYYFGGGAGTDFTNFCNGNNVDSAQTADQVFETITDGLEDFTPETGSDLLDAGLGRTN